MNEWARNLDNWNDRFEENVHEPGYYQCGCAIDETGFLEPCREEILEDDYDLDSHFEEQHFYSA